MELRILIHTPIGKDAYHVSQILHRSNIDFFVCSTPLVVINELEKGAAALLLVEEALSVDFLKSLTQFLQQQKTWSDIPVLLICKRGLDSPDMRFIYQRLGNVTLIERPIQIITLLATINSALRARKRQYEMREVDRRKDEFLAMLAHELRNPLAPISAASHILKLGELNRERTNHNSEIILRQVNHMTGLIDDLLDVSRVSRGLIDLETEIVNVQDITEAALEQVLPLINAKKHQIEVKGVSEQIFVMGDKKRLIQILTNLLNNAAKYTNDGGSLNLSIVANTENVFFEITDSGIGIDAEIVDSIFDMFIQAKRTSDRSQGGLGIGLALVKNLVELHHGEVKAHSEGKGQGSTFTVKLPRAKFTINSVANPIKPDSLNFTTRRLLVVDDNVDAADTLSQFLETFGYEVMVEYNATMALARAIASPPDACLLDIGLPDMDGNELAKRLRENHLTKSALLIAITGYGQDQDRLNTTQAGFDYHFVKPVKVESLIDVLKKKDILPS